MGTLVSSFITKARRRINEVSTTFHSDADLIAYIDEAQKYIVENNLILEEISTTSSESGTNNYALPSDFISAERLLYDGIALEPISFQDIDEAGLDEDDFSDDPVGYYIFGDEFFFFPTPNSVRTIKLFYYKKPIEVTLTTQTLELGTEYDGAVLSHCVYAAYLKDKQFDMADYALAECNTKTGMAVAVREERKGKKPRMKMSRTIKVRSPLEAYHNS